MAFPTTSILDNFNVGADAAPPDANWSRFRGLTADFKALTATGNVTSSSVGVIGWDYWNPGTFGPDTEIGLTVSTLPGNNQRILMFLRVANPTGSINGYALQYTFITGAGNDTWTLFRYDTGTPATLATVTGQDLTAGDKIGFGVSGSTLTGYKTTSGTWAAIPGVTATDATYGSAGYLGLGIEDTTVRVDDFFGGTVVAAGANPWNKVITQNFTPEFDIIEYGSRFYSGSGNAPTDWTVSPDTGTIFPRVINPYYY